MLAAAAAALPGSSWAEPLALSVREQALPSFFRALASELDRPVVVAPEIGGSISGAFEGEAYEILERVAQAQNLITFDDGVALYVYPPGAIASRTFAVDAELAERLPATIGRLGIADRYNRLRRASPQVLIATGSPRFLELVDQLRQGEAESAGARREQAAVQTEFRVFPLRYARAADQTLRSGSQEIQLPGVVSLLRTLAADGAGGAALAQVRASTATPGVPRRLGGAGLADRSLQRLGLPPEAGLSPGLPLRPTEAASPQAPADAPAPSPAESGSVRIEADPRQNAVVIRDAAARMAGYEALIAALDVPQEVVEIEAAIIELDAEQLDFLGVQWSVGTSRFGAGFTGAPPPAEGLTFSALVGNRIAFQARLDALRRDGKLRIVSRPRVLTLANTEAVLSSEETFFVRVAGEEAVDLFDVAVGTSLQVTPDVFLDRDQEKILLDIDIRDGAVTGQEVDAIPMITQTSVSAAVVMQEGQGVLLGGLTMDRDELRVSRAPLLGDAPLIGPLFRTTARSARRKERLFLITPRVLRERTTSATPSSVHPEE